MPLDIHSVAEIPFAFNNITIHFSANNVFSDNLKFQYLLQGVDKDWSEPQKINKISYARLSVGKYQFQLKTINSMGEVSKPILYTFEVLPPWYLSSFAYIGYVLLIITISIVIWQLVQLRYRKMHIKKLKIRESNRLHKMNERLRLQVEEKNAELLSQTSFIIQRNELILKIKDEIEQYAKEQKKTFTPLFQKVTSLLNKSMDMEDDWNMFLIRFEEKHTGFFQSLKTNYPQLTPSDLRLCACLRLNMETKDIASLMNVSIRSIENSRYRIRKKLNIPQHINLTIFFMDV